MVHQGLLSMGFSRQGYWNGLQVSSPGHLPDQWIEPGSPISQADSLPSEPPGKPNYFKWGWSNQSILKEISPGISLEGMMLKLKLQYFGHLMWRVDSLQKTLMLGGIGGRRGRGWQRMRRLDGITDSMESEWTPGVGDGQEALACWDSWGRRVGQDRAIKLNCQNKNIRISVAW